MHDQDTLAALYGEWRTQQYPHGSPSDKLWKEAFETGNYKSASGLRKPEKNEDFLVTVV